MNFRGSILSLACAMSICVAAPLASAGEQPTPRVINGTTGSPFAAASVAIETPDFDCTAGLWKPRILITAAHCINDKGGGAPGVNASDFTIYPPGGNTTAGPSPVKVAKIIFNPNWTETGDDIAFLILNVPLATPIITRMASVEEVTAMAKARTPITYVGYGVTGARADTNSQISTTPLWVTQPLIPSSGNSGVFELKGDRIHGTCAGDSGGPFMVMVGAELLYLGPLSGGLGPPCESDDEESSDEAAVASAHLDLINAALAAAGDSGDPTACAEGPDIDRECKPGHTWKYSFCWDVRKASLQKQVDGVWQNIANTTGKRIKGCSRKYPYEINFSVTEAAGAYDYRVAFPKQSGLSKTQLDPFTLTVT